MPDIKNFWTIIIYINIGIINAGGTGYDFKKGRFIERTYPIKARSLYFFICESFKNQPPYKVLQKMTLFRRGKKTP